VQSPGLPKSPEGDPVFPEPWAAEAFAMTVHLHERGLFTWSEWAAALSGEVHKPGRAEDGSDYFDCWVAALSGLVAGPVHLERMGRSPFGRGPQAGPGRGRQRLFRLLGGGALRAAGDEGCRG